jgi:hypothetical protein
MSMMETVQTGDLFPIRPGSAGSKPGNGADIHNSTPPCLGYPPGAGCKPSAADWMAHSPGLSLESLSSSTEHSRNKGMRF